MDAPIQVFSEIGKLKKVLLKRPGAELEHITPDTMEELLFDELPALPIAQKEHDSFAQRLRENDTEVLYLEELVAESLTNQNVKRDFLHRFLAESDLCSAYVREGVMEYLLSLPTEELVAVLMGGLRRETLDLKPASLAEMVEENQLFLLKPLTNLYFTRDTSCCVGRGVTINPMFYEARKRESLFAALVWREHPRFKEEKVPVWIDREARGSLEGGDLLVLSPTVLAVGLSQRSDPRTIEKFAQNLFAADSGFEKIVAIKIPKNRAMMHLDTVFTMVDRDKFTIHPAIQDAGGAIDCYILEPEEQREIVIQQRNDLQKILKEVLEVEELVLIPTGDSDPIVAPREQWTDGSNTLAIAPGVVVTYDRNYVSNELLRSHGVKVIEIPSGELSRGRGGPRCMSQPIWREGV